MALLSAFSSYVEPDFFPLHSLRRIFPHQAKASICRRLERLPDDQIFALGEDGGSRKFAMVRRLPWDSQFFEIDAARIEQLSGVESSFSNATLEEAAGFVRKVLTDSRARGVNYLTIQVDAADVLWLQALQKNGFVVMDTIACYLLDLRQAVLPPTDSFVRQAAGSDIYQMTQIARDCFSNVQLNANRFISDPYLDPVKVAELYSLWAEKSVAGPMADLAYVYDCSGSVCGFITVDLPKAHDLDFGLRLASIPLNAVAPLSQGKGVYSALVARVLEDLSARSGLVEFVDIRTQIPNLAVHRTWQKLGACLALTYHTLRWTSLAL